MAKNASLSVTELTSPLSLTPVLASTSQATSATRAGVPGRSSMRPRMRISGSIRCPSSIRAAGSMNSVLDSAISSCTAARRLHSTIVYSHGAGFNSSVICMVAMALPIGARPASPLSTSNVSIAKASPGYACPSRGLMFAARGRRLLFFRGFLKRLSVSGRLRRCPGRVTIAADVNEANGLPSTATEVRSAHLPAGRRNL